MSSTSRDGAQIHLTCVSELDCVVVQMLRQVRGAEFLRAFEEGGAVGEGRKWEECIITQTG